MKNITPQRFRCAYGACPAVYEHDGEVLAVVGRRDPSAAAQLAKKGKVAPHEEVIFIDRAFFAEVNKPTKRTTSKMRAHK